MRKLYKLMTIEGITIQLDDRCSPSQLSRVRFRVLEDGDPARNHTTQLYATITENKISWAEPLQLRYNGQSRLSFETFCEHEYGYQQRELQVLYRGSYYLRNEMFFRRDSTHIYDLEGEKKGVLKWEIRVVTKQEQEWVHPVEQKEQPLVREDLIGLIKLHEARLQISNPVFNAKKHQQSLTLRIKFAEKDQIFKLDSLFKWNLNNLKLQYVRNGPKTIEFWLCQDGRVVLDGKTDCETIQQHRRYIHHKVPVFNRSATKVGTLLLDCRYIAKQELLDLIYSPKSKLGSVPERCQSSGAVYKATPPHTILNNLNKGPKQKYNESSSIFNISSSKMAAQNRYKIGYLMNHNSDIKIPRATRFSNSPPINPNISYLDPEKVSDFAVKRQRGPYITKSAKFDFTRQFKDNPGVGSYKLPSIWSKY